MKDKLKGPALFRTGSVAIAEAEDEITIRVTGTAYRNLARIAEGARRMIQATSLDFFGSRVDEEKGVTPAAVAELLAGELTLLEDAEGAVSAVRKLCNGDEALAERLLAHCAFEN